ncbi:MAG: metal-dependent hydrolase [Promethearchaeota archaeon]
MDFFTHLVFGGLMYLLLLGDVTLDYFFLAIIFSILPDLDIFLAPLRRFLNSKYLEHRGGSHSYLIGLIISLLASVIISPLTQKSFFVVWIIGFCFYGLHVSMDLLTTTKIPYLFPISKKEHCFYVEKAGSMFTFINSIIFILLPVILFRLFPGVMFIQFYITFYTYFFIIYYCYRIISKFLISSTLEPNQKYLPGILPFYYRIYSHEVIGNEITSSIEKKMHFSKNKVSIKVSTTLNTQEKIFLEMAEKLNKKHYYFSKWTSFPIFVRTDEIFSIKFFFLETMMHKRTMLVQYDFNKETNDLISSNQKSGPIQSI